MKRRQEAGQSLVLVALVMVVLIGFLGFAIDFGYYRFLRRQLQTAADAAAIAGAMDFTYGDYSVAGQAASAENGFTNGGGITVTMSKPPTTGPYAGAAGNYVQATVTDTAVPTFFSKIFGATAPHLSATAVAEGGINCLYGLDTAANSPFTLTVSAVDLQCGVVSNNTFVLNGGELCAPSIQSVNWPAGTTTCLVGTSALPVKIPSTVTDPFCPASGCVMPQPSPAALPAKGTCSAGTYSVPPKPAATVITQANTYGANYCGITITSSGTTANPVKFSPGNFYGPITISNSVVTFQAGSYAINSPTKPGITLSSSIFGNSQLNFQSGSYTIAGGIQDNNFSFFGSYIDFNSTPGSTQSLIILDGGGLNLGFTAAKSTGGVTIFNTGTSSCAATSYTCYGQIISTFSFSGTFCGAKCTLNPSTSGLYPGILFYQDRTYTYSASCPFGGSGVACFGVNINVNPGTVAHNGTYYFPSNTVNFDFDFGAGTTWNYLIAKDVKWFVGFTFNSNVAAVPTTFPLRQGSAALVQ